MKRLLTAVIVLPFLIASILIASLWWLFVALAVAAMVLALWEFYLLAKKLQLKPDPTIGYVAGAALVTISLLNDPASILLVQFVIIATPLANVIGFGSGSVRRRVKFACCATIRSRIPLACPS